jgi:hypothetical protein
MKKGIEATVKTVKELKINIEQMRKGIKSKNDASKSQIFKPFVISSESIERKRPKSRK